jgi:oligopeptidase B
VVTPALDADAPVPPVAPRHPQVLTTHGDVRVDDWYWLRERDDPEVLDYLRAENAYTDAVLAPTRPVAQRIFDDIRSRVQETDVSAPVPDGPWDYYSRTFEGRQYGVHCRKPRGASTDAGEVVLLDENALADGHEYFSLGGFDITPDHRVLAYSIDLDGGERYTLRFRDLDALVDFDDVVENVSYGLAWSNDARTCFYVRPDGAMRSYQVWRHTLGTKATDDVLVFQEDDNRFHLGTGRTRSGRYVLIETASKTTSEVWFVPTDAPESAPRVVAPRIEDHEYTVEHHWSAEHGDRFFIVTNRDGATNFELAMTDARDPSIERWTTIVAARDDVRLESVDAFAQHLVLSERNDGLTRLRVAPVDDTSAAFALEFPDPTYAVWIGANEEFDTDVLRYGYTSLVAPFTDFDFDMTAATATVVRVQPIPGYDASQYMSTRVWVDRPNGVRVPMSIVHRTDVSLDGSAPALLYGYGSYEISTDATFRASRLPLLDRGFVYAIAHVRGGGELGRGWYEDGRLEHKEHTFTDFIACAEALIVTDYTRAARLVARGGSAGGLLMGAVVNMRPDLFSVVVAQVPFVDVVTTMLDASLPLTVTEWEEWGDPREPDAYTWMKRYSPYDNVHDAAYPAMFVTTGLNDPRVAYWEPAKWVAKLRAHSTSGHPIVLRTELGAGHGGPSGRYDAWREESSILAFVFDQVGVDR